ncbi:MAG: GDP-mannose 4,6-dehydratase [Candidatus Promineifilaceae bacterium]
MRLFLTGATGFAGSHLTLLLLRAGHTVHALVHPASGHQPLPLDANFRPHEADLLAADAVRELIASAEPEVVFHLAGQASPSASWTDPAHTFEVNTVGTANVLQACLAAGRPRVVVVTSSQLYGDVSGQALPITEATTPRPKDPYGLSKLAAGQLCRLYWERYQLPAIEARPFNHIGPRQAPGFVVADFAHQLAAIKLGQRPAQMRVGNLSPRRDFCDVRDVASAYWLLAERGAPGEAYVICSGRPVAISELLELLIAAAGLEVEVDVTLAQELNRPASAPCLYGSYAKLERDTGWRPEIPLERSLEDALTDWLGRLAP